MPTSDNSIQSAPPSTVETQNLASLLTIQPGHPLRGGIGLSSTPALPGDKSLSHRAALLAAMAEGESRVENFLVSGVTRAMLDALTTLGVRWSLDGTTLTVQGSELQPRPGLPPVTLQCGNSATTLRLLAGALAAWGRSAVLDGSPGLRRRPIGRIIEPLQQMGVAISAEQGCAPLWLSDSPGPLRSIDYRLPVASAQLKSCLLLAALAADGVTTLAEPGPSRDHTERMLRAMGVRVTSAAAAQEGWLLTRLEPPRPLALMPLEMQLPGDMSAAAFLIVAGLITPGSELTISGVGLNPTRTGLLDTLLEMGAEIEIHNQREQAGEPVGDLSVRHSTLQGVQIGGERVVRMIDEFPVLAVAAACARGTTVVADAQELRHKESDRITALGCELRQLSVDFRETADGFVVYGGKALKGGRVDPHGDHRLAMSLAVAGLVAQSPVEIMQAEIINESFPGYEAVLNALGASVAIASTDDANGNMKCIADE
jgi:3-phosphoshikimate 1-carboxyvinyltransferase